MKVEKLAKLLKESRHTVVLTGAGMDTESNIPDFRGRGGWWRNVDPRLVANIDTFHSNYKMFQEFYSMRLKLLNNIEPHQGHYILADFEKRGIINSIATQNVSGLHSMAGSRKIYELHGNISRIRCNNCNGNGDIRDFLNNISCPSCGENTLRPDIVLFGETLPMDVWQLAHDDIRQSDLLIVIGTSLEVYPVNQFPKLAKGKLILINNEDIGSHYHFDMKIIGRAKEILEELDNIYNCKR